LILEFCTAKTPLAGVGGKMKIDFYNDAVLQIIEF
jgi:hypothetical protein